MKPKKKKKKNQMHLGVDKTHVHLHMGIFVPLSASFSPHFGKKNILVGSERKHPSLTVFFPSPLPIQTPFKKFSILIFSIFFSILPKIHSTKHTLRVYLFGGILGRMENLG